MGAEQARQNQTELAVWITLYIKLGKNRLNVFSNG